LFLAGILFANPNGMLPRVLSYFPLTSPTTMLIRLPLTNVPPVDIVASIVLLGATIPMMIWVGARLFRLGLLMYSQRPTIDQMWRALRQS
jgi:ABC-2 type transport system permease protein